MAEKRVSVRLAAVGGKRVRAELEGIGEAGISGEEFTQLDTTGTLMGPVGARDCRAAG